MFDHRATRRLDARLIVGVTVIALAFLHRMSAAQESPATVTMNTITMNTVPKDAVATDTVTADTVAKSIDTHFREYWSTHGIPPAAPINDEQFLRRITLDLAGRIPTLQELRQFQRSAPAGRREETRRKLIASAAYTRHWSRIWRSHLLPQADTPKFESFAPGFEAWLREQLARKVPYDQWCREILISSPFTHVGKHQPEQSFLLVAEGRAELMAGNMSRTMLGVNLDCAQCHNHPHGRWTRNQFWNFATFFVPLVPATSDQPARFVLQLPDEKESFQPQLFVSDELEWPAQLDADTGRTVLANWMTSKANPYFARNAVNVVWAQLLGRGLVEPLDDLSDNNPAKHPIVLALLADAFIKSHYDLRTLIHIITSTEVYQLASDAQQREVDAFSSMPVRGLSGDQLFDSMQVAGGYSIVVEDVDAGPQAIAARRHFVKLFHDARPATSHRSILQSLELHHGPYAKRLWQGRTVSTAATVPLLDIEGRIALIYESVLSREPTHEELERWKAAFADADKESIVGTEEDGTKEDSAMDDDAAEDGSSECEVVLQDLFWVLLISAEFGVNY